MHTADTMTICYLVTRLFLN